MIYNQAINYNSSNVTYSGTLIISAPSILNPIIINNVTFIFPVNEDYSNFTTIGIISIEIGPESVVSLEVLDQDVDALISAQVISIGSNNEISILA